MSLPANSTRLHGGLQRSLLQPDPRPDGWEEGIEPKGVIYTKPWVANLLLDLAGYCADVDLTQRLVVEPAAGHGAFLRPMIERMVASCRRFGHSPDTLATALVAFELNATSAQAARAAARDTLIGLQVDAKLAKHLAATWVRCGDYLLESMDLAADWVVGNPPYVRLEEIPESQAAHYRQTYQTMGGRADLYIAFFEAALRQLKPGGACAFICADRWMRNQYGAELRRLITSSFAVEVIVEMHHADAFHDEVDAYPAISVLRRQPQATAVVACANGEAAANAATVLATFIRSAATSTASAAFAEGKTLSQAGISAARVDGWFQGADPWPCTSPAQLALLRRLEDRFHPVEFGNTRVGIGVATGADRVFITREPETVEADRLVRLAMAKDLAGGTLHWSEHYLVNPWSPQEGLVDLRRYPRLRAYLEAHREQLGGRHTARKSPENWYRTIDRVDHALTTTPKLYVADIKERLIPVLDRGETYPHHNLYFIVSEDWDLEVLGGLLLSDVAQFFVASYGVRMRGGYFRFQAQYLRRIRLPTPASLGKSHATALRRAFRQRDTGAATATALAVYGIEQREMEIALGR